VGRASVLAAKTMEMKGDNQNRVHHLVPTPLL
jgi:hypothetical protein